MRPTHLSLSHFLFRAGTVACVSMITWLYLFVFSSWLANQKQFGWEFGVMTDFFFSLCSCPPLPTNSMLVISLVSLMHVRPCVAGACNVVNLPSFLPASERQENFAYDFTRGSWSASSVWDFAISWFILVRNGISWWSRCASFWGTQWT